MALSNAERQARWRSNHSDLDKQRKREWIHKARVEGRVPWTEYSIFKGNGKRGQLIAKRLFGSPVNGERQAQLESIGVKVQYWKFGRKSKIGLIHLEQNHDCIEQCKFFGHAEAWVDIEPVAYKVQFYSSSFPKHEEEQVTRRVHFLRGSEFGYYDLIVSQPKAKLHYWIFKRYLKIERKLDFPNFVDDTFPYKCAPVPLEESVGLGSMYGAN